MIRLRINVYNILALDASIVLGNACMNSLVMQCILRCIYVHLLNKRTAIRPNYYQPPPCRIALMYQSFALDSNAARLKRKSGRVSRIL